MHNPRAGARGYGEMARERRRALEWSRPSGMIGEKDRFPHFLGYWIFRVGYWIFNCNVRVRPLVPSGCTPMLFPMLLPGVARVYYYPQVGGEMVSDMCGLNGAPQNIPRPFRASAH